MQFNTLTMKRINILVLIPLFWLTSCIEKNPNNEAEEILIDRQVENQTFGSISGKVQRKVYVPIYSDIYTRSRDSRTLLTATLSIRNTSETDTLYISRVDYYNTQGDLVRKYLEQSIFLKPLESLDYVIDEEDDTGGTGANFMLEWYAERPLRPIVQAVMMSSIGNRAVAFTAEGIEVD